MVPADDASPRVNRTLDGGENILPAPQEQQRVERLVLSGRRDQPFACKVRQERRHLHRPHVGRVTLAVKKDEALDPMDITLLGAIAVVAAADRIPHLVQETPRLRLKRLIVLI